MVMFFSDYFKFLLLIAILLIIYIASSVILGMVTMPSEVAVPRDVLSSHIEN